MAVIFYVNQEPRSPADPARFEGHDIDAVRTLAWAHAEARVNEAGVARVHLTAFDGKGRISEEDAFFFPGHRPMRRRDSNPNG